MLWLLLLAVSFAVTYVLTPWAIRKLTAAGMVGRDLHKKGKVVIPEMGGFVISLGFVAAMIVAIGFGQLNLTYLFAALATILIVTMVGIADDFFDIRQSVKAFLPLFAAAPLMAIRAGVRTMVFPFFGQINTGLLYPLALIPAGVTGAANAVNMLAGLNGLEVGLGIIMHGTVLISALLYMMYDPAAIYGAVISASMLGALVAFWFYNRYPAKIFPGDVATLGIGAALATAVILGNMEKIGIILIAPYFVELLLKARTRFHGESYGTLQKDGTIAAPKKICSLTHVAMSLGRLKEWQVVGVLLTMEAVFGLLALASVVLTLRERGIWVLF